MEIKVPDTSLAREITDLWVALASGQHEYGSHLLADDNRTRIRESVVRHIVTDSLLVALDDGNLVGFIMYSVESGSFEQDVRRGVINNLFVDESHRRETVGQQLLDSAEAALADRGIDVVALEVMAENTTAREFYRSNGYCPHRMELEKSIDNDSKGDV